MHTVLENHAESTPPPSGTAAKPERAAPDPLFGYPGGGAATDALRNVYDDLDTIASALRSVGGDVDSVIGSLVHTQHRLMETIRGLEAADLPGRRSTPTRTPAETVEAEPPSAFAKELHAVWSDLLTVCAHIDEAVPEDANQIRTHIDCALRSLHSMATQVEGIVEEITNDEPHKPVAPPPVAPARVVDREPSFEKQRRLLAHMAMHVEQLSEGDCGTYEWNSLRSILLELYGTTVYVEAKES